MSENFEIKPDRHGGFELLINGTPQSWVNLEDPTDLPYEYMQRIVEALERTVFRSRLSYRPRIIHLGGGALTIPRYIYHQHPGTAQIVCEPNIELTKEVRRLLPLPKHCGIKVRDLNGRAGIAAMPNQYADAVIIDAFAGDKVPKELATVDFFAEVNRILRPTGIGIMNLSDKAPFAWTRRLGVGIKQNFRHLMFLMETATWKGRRFGNILAYFSNISVPEVELETAARMLGQTYKMVGSTQLNRWLGTAKHFTELDSLPSPGGKGWFQ